VKSAKTRTYKLLGFTLAALIFALCSSAEAQQLTNVPRIGYLSGSSLSAVAARVEAFRQGLRELGYVEGKNIVIEWRDAKGDSDRVREMASELVRLKVDIIVSPGPTVTRLVRDPGSHAWPSSETQLSPATHKR
jgi:ABC-type uncharacterized transport system substrate-binding protein